MGQQLKLASELKSDRLVILEWGNKWRVNFDNDKNKIYLFNWSKHSVVIAVKMDGFNLEEKKSFKILEVSFSSKLDWGSYIMSIVKTTFKNLSFDLWSNWL